MQAAEERLAEEIAEKEVLKRAMEAARVPHGAPQARFSRPQPYSHHSGCQTVNLAGSFPYALYPSTPRDGMGCHRAIQPYSWGGCGAVSPTQSESLRS